MLPRRTGTPEKKGNVSRGTGTTVIRIMLPGEQVLQRKGQCYQENRYSRGKGNVTRRTGTPVIRVILPGEQVLHR